MRGWWPCPSSLHADPRVRAVSRAARGVLHALLDAADGARAVPVVAGDPVRTAWLLAAEPGEATPAALAAPWAELLAVALVVVEGREIRLQIAAPALRGPAEAPAAPARPPSADPARVQARKDAWRIKHGLPLPARAPVATPSTQAPPATRPTPAGEDRNDPRNEAGNDPGTTRERPLGNEAGTRAERPGNDPGTTPSVLPENSSLLREIETNPRTEGAGAERPGNDPGTTPAERGGNEGGTTPVNDPGERPPMRRPGRPRQAPPPDPIPMPGTVERSIYDAIAGDPVLAPITEGPGAYAARLPGMFPHLRPEDLAAQVRRAGEWAGRKGKAYSSGRAFLSHWLRTADDEAAARPAPACRPTPVPARPPTNPRRVGPDRPATAEDFARELTEEDPLIAIAEGR